MLHPSYGPDSWIQLYPIVRYRFELAASRYLKSFMIGTSSSLANGHITRTSPEMDHRWTLQAAINGAPAGWRRPRGRRTVETNLWPANVGLHMAWHWAQNRTDWNTLHAGACCWWWPWLERYIWGLVSAFIWCQSLLHYSLCESEQLNQSQQMVICMCCLDSVQGRTKERGLVADPCLGGPTGCPNWPQVALSRGWSCLPWTQEQAVI